MVTWLRFDDLGSFPSPGERRVTRLPDAVVAFDEYVRFGAHPSVVDRRATELKLVDGDESSSAAERSHLGEVSIIAQKVPSVCSVDEASRRAQDPDGCLTTLDIT